MTVFTDTWNAAFEATPADTEARSLGASRMRQLRKAVRERMAVEHLWAGDVNDGVHKHAAAKNVIINGNFDVVQRGLTFTGPSNGDYLLDRFRWEQVGIGVVDVIQGSVTPDPVDGLSDFYLEVDVTTLDGTLAASDVYDVQTRIEGLDAMRFGFGTSDATELTLSFWAQSSKTGIHCVAFQNSAADRSYVVEYTIASANTWEFFTITLTADTSGTWLTDSGVGLIVIWALGVGSDFEGAVDNWNGADDKASVNQVNVMDSAANFFRLSRVQLEVGPTATTFERRHYQQEFALCRRYTKVFGKDGANISIGVSGDGTGNQGLVLPTLDDMRVSPTGSTNLTDGNYTTGVPSGTQWRLIGRTGNAITKTGTVTISINGARGNSRIRLSIATWGEAMDVIQLGSTAHITFDAEL